MNRPNLFGFTIVGAMALASSGVLYGISAQDEAPKPYLQSSDRCSSRVLYFGGNGIPGQFVTDYGVPAWKDEYDEQVDAAPAGTRFRFGKDFWTTLDTNVSLSIGNAEVPSGHYYVALEKTEDGFSLILLDSADMRAEKYDAYQSGSIEDGITVPMQHEESDDSEEDLTFDFVLDGTDVELEVLWGPHRLWQPVLADI